jgi:stearoyl-CoA desaturase (delta-9 desaturase)
VSFFDRDRTFNESVNWITTFFMAAFHLSAVAALVFFTWKGLLLAVVLAWVSGSLGIGMG